jgi:CBS domain-containing protein
VIDRKSLSKNSAPRDNLRSTTPISEGNIGELRRYPGIVTRTISTKTTNFEALQKMTAQNIEALVVIDEDGKLKGVVEREQILSKLLLGMAK